jgi:hypothetical protein
MYQKGVSEQIDRRNSLRCISWVVRNRTLELFTLKIMVCLAKCESLYHQLEFKLFDLMEKFISGLIYCEF